MTAMSRLVDPEGAVTGRNATEIRSTAAGTTVALLRAIEPPSEGRPYDANDMITCSRCEGFVPPGLDLCPHCDHTLAPEDVGPSAARRLAEGTAKVAAAGAMMATLMACYGAGYYDEPQPQTQPQACELITTLPADGYVEGDTLNETAASNGLYASCGGSNEPERIYAFQPGANAGQSGTLKVLWQADAAVSVYVLDQCIEGIELGCEGGENSGTLEVPVDALGPMTIVIDGAGGYAMQVVFEPGPAPPG